MQGSDPHRSLPAELPEMRMVYRREKMNDWIEIKTETNIAGLTVHEVKCPYCGYRETFHSRPSAECYICSRPLGYKRENTAA